jgi:hypothetical protein
VRSDPFVAAVEARSPEQLEAALAPDVRFLSPVVFRPYQGREVVLMILVEGAMKVLEDFRYVHRLAGEQADALIFRARVADREVDGLDLLSFDGQGRVRELMVMARPLSGLTALAGAMGRRFEQLGIAPPAGSD